MLSRFLLTLFSSWAVNPLGVLFAHSQGFGQELTILLLLLGTGACVPFQLFMNECLAAGRARKSFQPSWAQLNIILIAQAATCIGTLLVLPNRNFDRLSILVLALLLTFSNGLSYRCSVLYFKLAIHKLLSRGQAVILGMLPGLVSLILFIICIDARQRWVHLSPLIFLLIAIVPVIIQWAYLALLSRSLIKSRTVGAPTKTVVSSAPILAALSALVVLTIIGTCLRNSIAEYSVSYAALIVVGLNSMVSLGNTLTHASFLSSAKKGLQVTLFIFSGGVALLALICWIYLPLLSYFLILLASQLSIIAVIEAARKISNIHILSPSINDL